MIKVKNLQIVAFAISAVFLLASTTAFAEYTQKQNEIIDPNERNTEQLQQTSPSSQQQGGEGMSGGQSSGDHGNSSDKSSGDDKSKTSDTDKKSGY